MFRVDKFNTLHYPTHQQGRTQRSAVRYKRSAGKAGEALPAGMKAAGRPLREEIMASTNETTIQVVDRTFNVIETLATCSENMSLTEISSMTGITKSATHRILQTLKARGYVAQSSNEQYYLTLKICSVSRNVLDKLNTINIARPYLKRLSSSVHQTVYIVAREGMEAVYLDRQEDATASFRMVSSIGRRRLLHVSAVGKSILAELSDDEIMNYWEAAPKPQLTPFTIMDLGVLFKEIDTIRTSGYAMDDQENTLGIRCMAVALSDFRGKPSYAISISTPVDFMTPEKADELKPYLFSIKESIMQAWGCG